jgi:hypothetical protein
MEAPGLKSLQVVEQGHVLDGKSLWSLPGRVMGRPGEPPTPRTNELLFWHPALWSIQLWPVAAVCWIGSEHGRESFVQVGDTPSSPGGAGRCVPLHYSTPWLHGFLHPYLAEV